MSDEEFDSLCERMSFPYFEHEDKESLISEARSSRETVAQLLKQQNTDSDVIWLLKEENELLKRGLHDATEDVASLLEAAKEEGQREEREKREEEYWSNFEYD